MTQYYNLARYGNHLEIQKTENGTTKSFRIIKRNDGEGDEHLLGRGKRQIGEITERERILEIIQNRIDETQLQVDNYLTEYGDDNPTLSHIENLAILLELQDLHNTIDPPQDGTD